MTHEIYELEGKSVVYKGNTIKIEKVKRVNSVYVVLTNKRTYNFFDNEVQPFLREIEVIDYSKREIKTANTSTMEETKNQSQIVETNEDDINIKKILVESINKVREDKTYIPQANAICNIVSQMINIRKLELAIKKQ